MPAPATTIDAHVRGGMRWPMKARAISAVRKGAIAMVTSTLATLVIVRATMKAVNMTLQHNPDSHSGQPPARTRATTCRPCNRGRITSSDSTVKKPRQNVTSKLRACSRWRVITPAMDHIRVTATMPNTAWVCVSLIVLVGKKRRACSPPLILCRFAHGALALVLLQVALAQAHRLGRDLD